MGATWTDATRSYITAIESIPRRRGTRSRPPTNSLSMSIRYGGTPDDRRDLLPTVYEAHGLRGRAARSSANSSPSMGSDRGVSRRESQVERPDYGPLRAHDRRP